MKSVNPIALTKWKEGKLTSTPDLVATEEPLEIRLGYGPMDNRVEKKVAITMRTPGHDFELSLGFLFNEGIISSNDHVLSIKYCSNYGKEENKENVVRVELKEGVEPKLKSLERNFYTTSSCGICGKASIDSVTTSCTHIINSSLEIKAELVKKLPEIQNQKQLVFKHTGGLHSSALFNQKGELINLFEDVGRHNALDKLIGWGIQTSRIPFSDFILLVSGRVSFELIQKAFMAHLPIVVAIGAPSSLAVDFADEAGITLVGFTKKESFNIYTHTSRIIL